MFCALIGLYNFGKQNGEEDTFSGDGDSNSSVDNFDDSQEFDLSPLKAGNKWMEAKRDEIAKRMWDDYLLYIQKA